MASDTTTEPLRVALLTPGYRPEVTDDGEHLAHQLAVGLAARGHRPRVITAHRGRPGRSVEDGVEIVRHWRPPDGRLRRRRYEDHLTHIPLTYLSLAQGDDQIVQALHVTDGLAAARWSARTGRPSILSYLGIPDRHELVAARRRIEITRAAARGCTAVTAVSEQASEAFDRWLGVRARVIHPPVDLEALSTERCVEAHERLYAELLAGSATPAGP